MGPLSHLFALIKAQNDRDYAQNGQGMDRFMFNTRIGHMADMPGHRLDSDGGEGPINLDRPPPMRPYNGPIDWLFNKPPAAPTPPFRDPGAQAGPMPPTGNGRLAAMFPRR